MFKASRIAAVCAASSLSTSIWAHHSVAIYDQDRVITLEGVVTEVDWANPHVFLMLETENDSGEVTVWAIEAPAPGSLSDKGWAPDTISVGEQVSVTVLPNRRPDSRSVRGNSLQKADGTVKALYDRIPRGERSIVTSGPASSLAGVWRPRLTMAWTFDADGPQGPLTWELTEAGREAVQAWEPNPITGGAEPRNLCGAGTPPLSMAYGTFRMITIDDGEISIHTSQPGHVVRPVRMDLDTFDNVPHSSQGTSIGRWEDEILIVESSRFSYDPFGNAQGLPGSDQRHVTERFELSPDGQSMAYSLTLTDPVYLAEPKEVSDVWAFYADADPSDLFSPCDLENALRPFQ